MLFYVAPAPFVTQAVKARHHQHIALAEPVQCAAQLRSVGACTARRFAEDFFTTGSVKLLHLRVYALPVCRYPCIAVNHGCNYAPDLCHKKAVLDQGCFLRFAALIQQSKASRKIVLRRRPVERHALLRPFLQRGAML
jgi:hypothetical protein